MNNLYSILFKDLDAMSIELDVRLPKPFQEEFEKTFKISYGEFSDGLWEADESGKDYVTLNSPTMSIYKGMALLGLLPEYADARITGIFDENGPKHQSDPLNVLKSPIKAAQNDAIYSLVAASYEYSVGKGTGRRHHAHYPMHEGFGPGVS